jgi:hypothetical protein
MSENYKVQVSTKVGGDMINFRGESSAEVAEQIEAFALVAGDILENLTAIVSAGKGLVEAQGETNRAGAPAPAAPAQGGYQAGPAQGGAPAQSPAGGGRGDGRMCPHGVMNYRDGNGAKGYWQAYFCALPKGAAGACEPQWIR